MVQPSADPPPAPGSADGVGEVLAFPAAVAQQVFWYLEKLQPGVTAFNVPMRFRLDGPLDPDLLRRALQAVVDRHESLRTHFEEDDGNLLQIVAPRLALAFPVHDLTLLEPEAAAAEAIRLAEVEAQRPFALETGPMFRAELVKVRPDSSILHVTVHHALFDGWSMTVLTEEIAALYQAFFDGRPDPLPPLAIQYGDFSIWQKEFLEGPVVAKQLAYWRRQLQGMAEIDLPADHPRPPVKTWRGDILSALFPKELTRTLQQIAARRGATLFHLFLAAFKVMLHRYTGATDIAVGTPITGRTRAEVEPLIGVFINSLIIRTDLADDPSFESYLDQVRNTAFEAVENQDLPFECLVRDLRPVRDESRNPLFQVNFTHQRSFAKPGYFGGVTLTPIPSRSPGAIFDLHFFMVERAEGWRVSCDYSTDLFTPETARRMVGHFQRLLESIADDPAQPVSSLEMLTAPEKQILLGPWAGEMAGPLAEATVSGLFAKAAACYPDRPALHGSTGSLSYARLAAAAGRTARRLVEAGLRPGQTVALTARPSVEMIVSLLGIVLAGGAYVPLDPDYPDERFRVLLDECGARLALADPDLAGRYGPWSGRCLAIEPAAEAAPAEPPFPPVPVSPHQPVYVLFTSGSTGRPKGVVVPHRAVARLVRDNGFLEIGPDDVFLQAAPVSFDASTLEIWGPLLNGAALVVPPPAPTLDQLAAAIRSQGVTTLWLTAGLFHAMIDEHPGDLAGLRTLLAGGDVLSVPQVRKALLALPGTRLVNGYGPTENTTFTTCHTITLADTEGPSIPIGRPLRRTTVFLLDEQGRPVPVGVPGELFTGGEGLALGYLGDRARTDESFVPSPLPGRESETLYRTGDLCRWRADGTIEFLGRRDQQVKVRGFRIEPGEIESTLAAHPGVRLCKVGVRGGGAGNKRILAWVVPVEVGALTVQSLQDHLEDHLPHFLQPDAIILLEDLPVNANGKVDQAALPEPEAARPASEAPGQVPEPPAGPCEERMAAIWRDMLGLARIGRDEDFFSLGGHSLLALRLFSRITKEFGASLPLASLVKHPTIRKLSALLEPTVPGKPAGWPRHDQPASTGLVVNFSEGHGDLPVFCIHGGDGAVLFYRSLACRLPAGYALHAIESLHLSRSEVIEPRSVEETAADYVRLLHRVQPEGPFRLAGYSFGGVVAHAMACLLAEAGQRVEFLGLFDTHNPAITPRRYSALERMAVFWRQHRKHPLPARLLLLARRTVEGIRTNRRVRADVLAAQSSGPAEAHSDLRRVQVREAHWEAMKVYRPRPYPGRITLFQAMTASDKVEWPPDYGWSGAAGGGLELVPVPGRHLTLFEPGHVEALGEAVARCLTLAAGKKPPLGAEVANRG